MKPRPTVLGLMGFVALVAVGMTALRSNDQTWAAIVLALTIFALCVSTLVGIYRRGAWAGFAVFGWALFAVCQPHSAPPVGVTTLPMTLACRAAFYLSSPARFPWVSFQIGGYPAIMTDNDGQPVFAAIYGTRAADRGMVPVNSLRAGLCLLCLCAGGVGAIVGSVVDRHFVARGGPGPDLTRSE